MSQFEFWLNIIPITKESLGVPDVDVGPSTAARRPEDATRRVKQLSHAVLNGESLATVLISASVGGPCRPMPTPNFSSLSGMRLPPRTPVYRRLLIYPASHSQLLSFLPTWQEVGPHDPSGGGSA